MGDRTYASVTFREEYWPLVEGNEDLYYDEADVGYGEVRLVDYEANYGLMENVTNELQKLFIPYDHYWEAGSDFPSGHSLVRFDENGGMHETEYATEVEGMMEIKPLLDKVNAGASIEQIRSHLEEELKKFDAHQGQKNVTTIPLRPLTDEESAIIMKYKMEKENKL